MAGVVCIGVVAVRVVVAEVRAEETLVYAGAVGEQRRFRVREVGHRAVVSQHRCRVNNVLSLLFTIERPDVEGARGGGIEARVHRRQDLRPRPHVVPEPVGFRVEG